MLFVNNNRSSEQIGVINNPLKFGVFNVASTETDSNPNTFFYWFDENVNNWVDEFNNFWFSP